MDKFNEVRLCARLEHWIRSLHYRMIWLELMVTSKGMHVSNEFVIEILVQ